MQLAILDTGTPGLAEKIGDTEILVSFEPGSRLMFVCLRPGMETSPWAVDTRYRLAPEGRDSGTKLGYYTYRGERYFLLRGAGAYLMVRDKDIQPDVREVEYMKGRRAR